MYITTICWEITALPLTVHLHRPLILQGVSERKGRGRRRVSARTASGRRGGGGRRSPGRRERRLDFPLPVSPPPPPFHVSDQTPPGRTLEPRPVNKPFSIHTTLTHSPLPPLPALGTINLRRSGRAASIASSNWRRTPRLQRPTSLPASAAGPAASADRRADREIKRARRKRSVRRVYCGAGRGGRTRQDAARRAAERAPPGTNRAKRRVCLTTAGAPNFRRGGGGGGRGLWAAHVEGRELLGINSLTPCTGWRLEPLCRGFIQGRVWAEVWDLLSSRSFRMLSVYTIFLIIQYSSNVFPECLFLLSKKENWIKCENYYSFTGTIHTVSPSHKTDHANA